MTPPPIKPIQPGQHIDHFLKQTRGHHVQLSSMADMKANMMMTAASLVIPLSAHYLTDERFKYAAITLISFCVMTVVLAAYAAMPKLFFGMRKQKVHNPDSPFFNILFFGDFVQLSYDEYKSRMRHLLTDNEDLYEAQFREVYVMGQYLATKKYRFLQLAYSVFITGVVLSGVVFLTYHVTH